MTRKQSATVLLVEDDQRLCDTVTRFLKLHAVEAVAVGELDAAKQLLLSHRFDAVILDLTLRGEDASGLLSEMTRESQTPVIVVSARIDEADRIIGLELGADDYLTKPFSLRELLARLRALWRRTDRRDSPADQQARFAGWTVDLALHQLIDEHGTIVRLTAGEHDLLRVFLRHPQQVLSRQDLLHQTRHSADDVFDRSIDVLVARLRRKLRDDSDQPSILETVRRSGYRFIPPVTWADS